MNTTTALKHKKCWLVTRDHMGQRAISVGVAKAMGISFEEKLVQPPWFFKTLAPWAGVAPSEKVGKPGSVKFPAPLPDLAIGVGRQSAAYLKALHKHSAGKTFTVMLQDPKMGLSVADMIWVPEHDRLRGDNVITTLLSPHRFSPSVIETLRQNPLQEIASLPRPYIGLIIGGNSKAYQYSPENIKRFITALSSLKNFAGSFLVTCSRRTPPELEKALRDVISDMPNYFWDGTGHNPYGDFLAHSDYLVVTADSVNMVGEAAVTGRPVYVFFPEGGGRRIDYFHNKMREEGITRALPSSFEELESWQYPPQYAADTIASEILTRWLSSQ